MLKAVCRTNLDQKHSGRMCQSLPTDIFSLIINVTQKLGLVLISWMKKLRQREVKQLLKATQVMSNRVRIQT